MSSNNEGKKKVHFRTAVSKRGVSDLRNDRKDHTIPRDSPLFLHYADNVEFYLESVLKKNDTLLQYLACRFRISEMTIKL